jgi:hypothetical protein
VIYTLSTLTHTWLIDLDGTVVRHNGYLLGQDELLPGVRELWKEIPEDDKIILLTAREEKYRRSTESFLSSVQIRFNLILFDLPVGERILINDAKHSGLQTALAVNVVRDIGLRDTKFRIDITL